MWASIKFIMPDRKAQLSRLQVKALYFALFAMSKLHLSISQARITRAVLAFLFVVVLTLYGCYAGAIMLSIGKSLQTHGCCSASMRTATSILVRCFVKLVQTNGFLLTPTTFGKELCISSHVQSFPRLFLL